jgi:hypothetical protein
MTDKKDDMLPDESRNKLPASLDSHLRAFMAEKELIQFREQLPDAFLSDASEGLSQLHDSKQLDSVLQQLNQQMHQQLSHKKMHRERRGMGDLSWTYWAIIIILLITITGFIVIRMFLKH